MAVDSFAHFGRATVEGAFAHRLLRRSTFRRHVSIANEERLRATLAEGKGAILVTGHLGVWELFGRVFQFLGGRSHVVYRPPKNPFADRFLREWRAALGQELVEREGALRPLLRALRDGGYIGLLMDQHAKRDGVWTPFFGRSASTTPAPALLALRTGAPILPGYLRRLPGTYRFELFFDEPLRVAPSGDRAADIERVTARLSSLLESYIRRTPTQWLWMHRRWRTPPHDALN